MSFYVKLFPVSRTSAVKYAQEALTLKLNKFSCGNYVNVYIQALIFYRVTIVSSATSQMGCFSGQVLYLTSSVAQYRYSTVRGTEYKCA